MRVHRGQGIAEGDASERALFSVGVSADGPAAAQPEHNGAQYAGRSRLEFLQKRIASHRTRFVAAISTALTTEWERGAGFLMVPILLGAGAIAYFSATREPGFVALAAGASVLSISAFLSRARQTLLLALAATLLIVLGMLLGRLETWNAGTKILGGEISTIVTGRVSAIEYRPSGRARLTLDILATAHPKLRYQPDRVRLSTRKIPDGLTAGSIVTGLARLFPPSGPLRPGSYDFAFESFFDGIGANGFFMRNPKRVDIGDEPSLRERVGAWIENARLLLAQHIRERIGGDEGEVASALVAGVRGGIPERVNEALRRTGLAHILSISGLHMALVAATIMVALRCLLAFFPVFASRRPVKKYAASIALCAGAAYLLISGSAVAAERSFIMLAVMLIAIIADRAALTMRNLAIAAIAIIAISPHEVIGPSFQMSFAATAALVGAYAWWSDRRSARVAKQGGSSTFRIFKTIAAYTLGLAMTSIIAGAATTIFGAYHFQRVSPLSLPANLAAMPIVSLVVMPFAVLGMTAMPFGLDGPFFVVMGKGLAAMIAVAQWFSDHSPIDAIGAIPVSAVIVLSIALAIATLATTWLRVFALPLFVVALAIISGRTRPDVLISEDGRLIAFPMNDGRLAVNRNRPNAFTVKDWMRSTRTTEFAKPVPPTRAPSKVAQGDPAGPVQANAASQQTPIPAIEQGFTCDRNLCIATLQTHIVIAHTKSVSAAASLCGTAELIVIDDATARNPCRGGSTTVITKRDLARRGAATVNFARQGSGRDTLVEYAIAEPFRPWHDHRRFSRPARGLPPYHHDSKKEHSAD